MPIENHNYGFERLTRSAVVFQADIMGANHTHFANVCDIGNFLIGIGIGQELWPSTGASRLIGPYEDSCSEKAFPIEQVQRIQNLYAVAFFRRCPAR